MHFTKIVKGWALSPPPCDDPTGVAPFDPPRNRWALFSSGKPTNKTRQSLYVHAHAGTLASRACCSTAQCRTCKHCPNKSSGKVKGVKGKAASTMRFDLDDYDDYHL
jgi:hypothetical protein